MDHVRGKPSRLNGENIAGAAFLILTLLFSIAGTINAVFGSLYPVYFLLAAIGIGLVVLGYRTWRIESSSTEKHITVQAKHRVW